MTDQETIARLRCSLMHIASHATSLEDARAAAQNALTLNPAPVPVFGAAPTQPEPEIASYGKSTNPGHPANELNRLIIGGSRPEPERDERAEFEQWAIPKYHPGHGDVDFPRYVNGDYRSIFVKEIWEAWQARAALERK